LEFSRREKIEWGIANGLCDLGFAELGAGRLDEARLRFTEAHAMAARMRWMENVAYGLVGFSALAVADGELEKAGKLLGHADHLAEEISLRFEPYAERVRAQVKRDLRSSLGEEELTTLRAEGRSLSMADLDALID
jgi:Flp pilus assembly protein TadD